MTKRKAPEDKQKTGRKSAYSPDYADQVRNLCPTGATDKDLSEHFGVSLATINNWKHAHPEFLDALKAGKCEADNDVVNALFRRANGYEYDEAQPIKLKTVIYDKGKRVREDERVEIVMVRRVVPPDTTACIFWLKNRQSAQWRDRKDLDLTTNGKDITVHFVDE